MRIYDFTLHLPCFSQLCPCYALAGKMDEAKTSLAEARRLNPKLSVKWIVEHQPDLPARLDGVRKAGLAEECPPRWNDSIGQSAYNLSTALIQQMARSD
jgi:hypothetical protein